jgi:hypothetical protein
MNLGNMILETIRALDKEPVENPFKDQELGPGE